MNCKSLTLIMFCCCAIVFIPVNAQSPKGEWISLFNGKDLSGWIQRGGQAIYSVENGEIVGTTVEGSPNSFLCTDKNYGDFIAELELKVDTSMNSGIQFRSNSQQEYQEGRVYGYQMEVDPSVRAWSGGIYDESRRGWLCTLEINPEAKTAFKNGQWNTYRIEAIGNHIRTFINNIPCSDLLDDVESSGFIALQVHSIDIGKRPWTKGTQVKWRNIRILTSNLQKNLKETKEIPQVNLILNTISDYEKRNGWKLLFDGKSLDGWRGALKTEIPEKGWLIKDGILSVISKGGGGDIVTKDQYNNFELTFDFKLTEGANSGVKYYVTENEYGTGALGLEFQILDDLRHPDAKKGRDGDRTIGSLYDIKPAPIKRPNAIGQWNTGKIVAKNNKIEHWLNGFKVMEIERGSKEYFDLVALSKYKDLKNFGMTPKGYILLQDHGDEVSYKNIKIRSI
jgi:hypothetical protein